MRVEPIALGEGGAFLVVFPAAERPAEAALAIIPDRPAPTRYFVLELGFDIVGEVPYWVLCEWAGDRHVNFGRCGEFESTDPTNVLNEMRDRVLAILDRETRSDPGGD